MLTQKQRVLSELPSTGSECEVCTEAVLRLVPFEMQVMGVNGVSHHVVTDDLEGATAVLQWLSTMPPIIGVAPANLPSSDPIERSITYCPSGSEARFCTLALFNVSAD